MKQEYSHRGTEIKGGDRSTYIDRIKRVETRVLILMFRDKCGNRSNHFKIKDKGGERGSYIEVQK